MKNRLNNLILERYPKITSDQFQAWNAADEYILKHLSETSTKYENILIIEDEFGALSLSTVAENKYIVCDSIINKKGIIKNFKNNQIDLPNSTFLTPFDNFPKNLDLILIKIPKNKSYLEFLLKKLNTYCKNSTPIIAGGMIKHLNKSVYHTFERLFSETHTSLGWKKSRLVFSKTTSEKHDFNLNKSYSEFGIETINYPNVFSYNKLDIGTRFFLSNFRTSLDNVESILDYGSGNGIMGIKTCKAHPDSELFFVDVNQSAILSAQATIEKNNIQNKSTFLRSENLNSILENSIDLIVCNPPFHEKHKVSTLTANEMIKESKKALKETGELHIIANRHLGYNIHMSKVFGNCEVYAQNNKFQLMKSVKN